MTMIRSTTIRTSVVPGLSGGRARPMRRLATGITAGALALSLVLGAAVPARADGKGDRLAKALVAAIVIGALVNGAKKGKAQPAPAPQPVQHPLVPGACAIDFQGAQRTVTVYPESCLRNEGFTARLPQHCANEARIYGRWDRIYGADCLREAGYRLQSW